MAGSQRSGPIPAGVRAGGVDAPVDDGGGVVGAEQLVLGGGVGQCGERVVAVCGDDGQVLAQHRPGLGAGQAGVELIGGDVQLGQRGRGGDLVGGFAEGVVVHGGGRTEAGEGVCGVAGCGGGRDLGAVAAQRRGQDVDGGLGVGGFGGDDAVRIGFGGGQIDVVFHAPAGQGDVKQLAGQGSRADDMAGVPGGESLRGVDGGRIAQRHMLFHIISGQAHHCSAAQVSGFNAAVVAGLDDLVAVAVAHIVFAADVNSSRVASGPDQVAW